jgi:hypothetical protein
LPKVWELLLLVVHKAVRDVVAPESLVELGLRYLVAIGKNGGEGRPPGTHGPAELLGHEYGLLSLRAAEETELSLDRPEPVIDIQRIHSLSEHRWCVLPRSLNTTSRAAGAIIAAAHGPLSTPHSPPAAA